MGRWAIMQAHIRFPLDGLRAFVNWTTLGQRASLYWGFFDPSWLFFSGTENTRCVARRSAVALAAGGGPLGHCAIAEALRELRGSAANRRAAIVLIGGFLIAPMAAATLGVAHNIGQAMAIVPFAVLLAGFGITRVLSAQSAVWRAIGFVLLAIGPIQFAYFYASLISPLDGRRLAMAYLHTSNVGVPSASANALSRRQSGDAASKLQTRTADSHTTTAPAGGALMSSCSGS